MLAAIGVTTPDQIDMRGEPARPHPCLFVVMEYDRPLDGGARHCLAGVSKVIVGRGRERHAVRMRDTLDLRLASGFLSTIHARFLREGNDWIFEDTGSRNGSFVNGRRAGRETLRDGDFIEVGHVLLRFRTLRRVTPPGDLQPRAGDAPPGFATLLPSPAKHLTELSRLAKSSMAILLLGETGTGKELVARAVHALSGRPGPLVAVNCAALSGTLLESQLFGHRRGAFTGATRDEPGFVRASDGGTLFLDEIGDLPAPAQAALLRVLQEREVVPVGSTRSVKVDLRVVAATHRMVDRLAARGDFRSDLYARLSGHVHYLTPLRERREDLGLIIGDILRRTAPARGEGLKLAAAAGRALAMHEWPLNVRELEQGLSRAVMLAHDGTLHAHHIVPSPEHPVEVVEDKIDEEDREATLRKLLERHRGNVSEVARALGKARMQIQRWMRRYAIDPATFR